MLKYVKLCLLGKTRKRWVKLGKTRQNEVKTMVTKATTGRKWRPWARTRARSCAPSSRSATRTTWPTSSAWTPRRASSRTGSSTGCRICAWPIRRFPSSTPSDYATLTFAQTAAGRRGPHRQPGRGGGVAGGRRRREGAAQRLGRRPLPVQSGPHQVASLLLPSFT